MGRGGLARHPGGGHTIDGQQSEPFRAIFAGSSVGMAVVTPAGRVITWNHALRSMLDLPAAVSDTPETMHLLPSNDELHKAISRAARGERGVITVSIEREARGAITVHVTGLPCTREGEPMILTEWRVAGEDQMAEQALLESDRRLRELQENLPVGIYRAGEDGTILTANPALIAMMGYGSFQELEDADLDCVWSDPRARDTLIRTLRDEGAVVGYTARLRRKDGSELIGSFDARGAFDERRRLLYFDTIVQDMTERVRAQEELKRLASTDSLTGVSNRQHLMAQLSSELNRAVRYHHPFSLMILDLDHFKRVNDSHGHLAGDKVLVAFGAIVRATVRSTDFAGRYGGEEFCVGLPETSLPEAVRVGERIREATAATALTLDDGQSLRVTCSIGIAEARSEGVDQLMARADAALYQAKQEGRNRVVAENQA